MRTVPFHSLLDELRNHNPTLKYKVKRVYRKCLERGHLNWAKLILEKYPRHIHYTDDIVLAFGLALQALKI